MKRRHTLPSALVAAGVALLAAAGVAAAAQSTAQSPTTTHQVRQGGTLVAELSTDVDYVDPGLDYMSQGWEIQYATGCKLLNYPDTNGAGGSQLVPEVAAGLPRVSNSGRTYTFTIRKGFRFADGAPVTAQSFADAFNRDASPKLQSPAQSFMTDIVGANAVMSGTSQRISGIVASGSTLALTLTKPAPDLLSRVAMPFFQAVPKGVAQSVDQSGVNTIKSCGPYYVADRVPGKSITLKRNPFYGGSRPHNLTQITYQVGNSPATIQQNVETGASDYAAQGLDPSVWKSLIDRYGVNKSRVFVHPILAVSYIAMNTEQPLFRNNVKLRQAVNYAIDRRAMLAQSGFAAGRKTDQILPPGIPGFRDVKAYPLQGPDLVRAKALAAGNLRGGKAVLWTYNRGAAPLRAQIIQYNLKQIGLDVTVQQFTRAVQLEKEGVRGAQFDLTDEAWTADYADPYDFVNVLLDGSLIQGSNNHNLAYLNDKRFNAQMRSAALLFGEKRSNAYATLDAQLTKNVVPWAARSNPVNRIFVSSHTGCFTYNGIYGVDLTALCRA